MKLNGNSANGKEARRVFDAHSLSHKKGSKAAKACDGADVLDDIATLQNFTIRLIAQAFGVSVSLVVAALRLTPSQRDSVRHGLRPLTLPDSAPQALPKPVKAEQRLADVVAELGFSRTYDALASIGIAEAVSSGEIRTLRRDPVTGAYRPESLSSN